MFWEGMRKDNRILAGFSRIKATEASPPLFLSFFFFLKQLRRVKQSPQLAKMTLMGAQKPKDLGTE